MNCGLSNLYDLKAQLLPAAQRPLTTYNDLIANIGKGVALTLEKHTHRKFYYTASDTETFPGDRELYYLSRCPVLSVAKVELRESYAATSPYGWSELTDSIENLVEATGLLYFGSPPGAEFSTLRVTYTGGYWFSIVEPEDGPASAQPAGSTVLPDDLKLAFFLQCRAVWNSIDKSGIALAQASGQGATTANLSSLDLLDQVKTILQPYIRFQIT